MRCEILSNASLKTHVSIYLLNNRVNNIKIDFNDNYKDNPDKLIITLSDIIKKGTSLSLVINYSAGFDIEQFYF